MEDINFRITEVTRIIHRTNSAGWRVENLYYEKDYVIALVLDGETEYIINDKKYLVQKNDVILFPPKTMRSGQTDPQHPWSFINITFRMKTNESADTYFNKSIQVWKNAGDAIRKHFQEASGAWTGKNPLYQVRCSLLATEILYKMILSEMPYQKLAHIKKLEKARNMIQENFRNEISIEELAASIDLSVSYFRRLFHEAYGCSPMQYIINLRIENARDLLQSGEVNVTEAALSSGFEDIYYFSTLFKRKTGSTPSQILTQRTLPNIPAGRSPE